MTDAILPPDDEIVAAVLDGEASADERARVAADPTAQERLAQFEAVRRQISAPVPVDAGMRERALETALAAFDAVAAPVQVGSTDGSNAADAEADPTGPRDRGDELAARRARPAGRARAVPILAAAAAVVLVLVGLGAFLRDSSRSAEVTATSSANEDAAVTSTLAETERATGGVDEATNEGPATTTSALPGEPGLPATSPEASAGVDEVLTSPAPRVDLGEIGSPAELRTRMTDVVDQQATEPTTGAPPPTTVAPAPDDPAFAGANLFADCGTYLLAVDPELAGALATATAVYQGRPAIVIAFAVDQVRFPAANGAVRVYALDAADCATLAVLTTR